MPHKVKRDKDRKSQTGRGKETSKKGAGGKFTWGAPGDELVDLTYEEIHST